MQGAALCIAGFSAASLAPYPLDAKTPSTRGCDNPQMSPDTAICPLGGQSHAQLRTIDTVLSGIACWGKLYTIYLH